MDYTVKKSIPHSAYASKDPFFFQTSTKFEESQFTKYKSTPDSLNTDLVRALIQEFNRQFDLSVYGMDILVDENDGKHYLIDVNYFASFGGIKKMDVGGAVKALILQKLKGTSF